MKADPIMLALRLEGFAVLAVSVLLYAQTGRGWWVFLLLLLTPDVAMVGYLLNPRIGALAYNSIHSYILPLGLGAIALLGGWTVAIPYLLIWTAHIGMDRFFGYGLKYPTSFGDTHLGRLRHPA